MLPESQKAQVIQEFGLNVKPVSIPVPEPCEDELLVNIKFTGVCHTDAIFMKNKMSMQNLKVPMVAGHEGSGVVVKVGSKVKKFKVGDRVGVKILTRACNKCEFCHKQNYEQFCDDQENCVSSKFGTFQQYATISEDQALLIPDGVDLIQAAPLQCAGVTVYRALKESSVKPGQFVVITGAAGGLGSCGLQFARAMGMRVIAVDLGEEKRQHCLDLGAEHFVDATQADFTEQIVSLTNGGPHGVVNIAPDPKSFEDALVYVRKTGTIVLTGLPEKGKFTADIYAVVMRGIHLKGMILGTREDFEEAMGFLSRGLINIPVEVKGLSELPEILSKLDKGEIKGRVILDTSK
ncbi:hypothetical protein FO519_008370 [Halicephalobus sp. NKZ332]|nr:hypothetical protein FO519_008370 [Halicephalobus sp. NKZ332]